MKFTVERDALAEAVAWVARALPTRPVVPVLTGLLLRTEPADATQKTPGSQAAQATSPSPASTTRYRPG